MTGSPRARRHSSRPRAPLARVLGLSALVAFSACSGESPPPEADPAARPPHEVSSPVSLERESPPQQPAAEASTATPGAVSEQSAATGPPVDAPLPASGEQVAEEARALIERINARFPETPDALELAARVRLWLGDSEAAAAAWRESLEIEPRYAYAYQGLGSIAAKKGDYAEAIDLFRKALEIEPGLVAVERSLGEALVNAGRADEAVEVLGDYLARFPRDANCQVFLGLACQQRGDFERAREAYLAAIEHEPDHPRAHFGLATVCTRLGRTDEAQKHSARYRDLYRAEADARRQQRSDYDDLDVMQTTLASFCTGAGRLYYVRGQADEAERLCRRAAALDSRQIECRQALGWMYREQGNLDAAVAVLAEAAEIAPDPATYWLEIGRIEVDRRRWQPAVAALEKAKTHDPQIAEIHALLGKALEKSGDRVAAAEAFRRAAEMAPEVEEYRRALDSLQP